MKYTNKNHKPRQKATQNINFKCQLMSKNDVE